ncbi:MAG: 5-oxoprolinase subunit PxpB [Clostridiales bacterium]|nr:5-oxoprolinase subunit PxpB [Clostridiales bacterium]
MGSNHVFVRFSYVIDKLVNQYIKKVYQTLNTKQPKGFIEAYYAYGSLTVQFDLTITNYKAMKKAISLIISDTTITKVTKGNEVIIPVTYNTEFGLDLALASDYLKLSQDEIIDIHSSGKYTVYMIGFLPGFCYLGGLDKRIYLPRKKTPRLLIPKGSVGIASSQTGVYPLDSPGGWQIIGRTNLLLYNPYSEQPFLLLPGDTVRFVKK